MHKYTNCVNLADFAMFIFSIQTRDNFLLVDEVDEVYTLHPYNTPVSCVPVVRFRFLAYSSGRGGDIVPTR